MHSSRYGSFTMLKAMITLAAILGAPGTQAAATRSNGTILVSGRRQDMGSQLDLRTFAMTIGPVRR